MLTKLRRQFIAVFMIIITVMLTLLMGLIYHVAAIGIEQNSVELMQDIADSQLQSSRQSFLPYFVLQVSPDGRFTASGDGSYDLGDQEYLAGLVHTVSQSRDTVMTLEEYGLRALTSEVPGSQAKLMVFTDLTREHAVLRLLAQLLLIIGALCFLVFLGISTMLAHWMVLPVDRAWQQQRQFVSDASHELKTPLTVIMTNAELLSSPDCDEGGRIQFSDNVLVMSRHMRNLVDRLLELARVDRETDTPEYEVLNFSSLVEESLLPFEPLLFERGLTLNSSVQTGLTVMGCHTQLCQVVSILLDNAQKYAPTNSIVALELIKTSSRRCRLRVSNPGQTLTRQEERLLFTRFYRKDTARSRDGSFGLGLSIADGLVRQHKGRIWCESGGGVISFFVELPLHK